MDPNDDSGDMPLTGTHPVPCIQTGNLVGLCERWIVEGVVHEEIDRAFEIDHRLTDMDEFRCPFAHDMRAQQASRIS